MQDIVALQKIIKDGLERINFSKEPKELYEPMKYFLSLGGKRMRPVLVLMGCELFGGTAEEALMPALGIELFHNFTLLHDDIMDRSPLRRAQPTVHHKWNENVAILSGDALFVEACALVMQSRPTVVHHVMDSFLANAMKVCEGQQLDMNYENELNISVHKYIHMISLKTAVLLGASLQIGAFVAGAGMDDTNAIYEFGKNIGIAFQLQDDILDVYGDEDKFGKQKGRDIVSNKKTFLLIKALEMAHGYQSEELQGWMQAKDFNEEEKVKAVTGIYDFLNVRSLAEQEMQRYFQKGLSHLKSVTAPEENKRALEDFARGLMKRQS